MQARGNVTEKGGHKKQLIQNRVKLGLAGEEKLTEEGGHRHGAKKQLNSVKLVSQNEVHFFYSIK